ncbi:hypothetical protein D9M69_640030 [compost metagenome]
MTAAVCFIACNPGLAIHVFGDIGVKVVVDEIGNLFVIFAGFKQLQMTFPDHLVTLLHRIDGPSEDSVIGPVRIWQQR